MRINDLELHHLRCLCALAEELNFGRAAERMNMSQPPLTRLVADVEKMLGTRLFARTTRQVALTPVGAVFVAEARAVLARAEEAIRAVTEAARREAGLLRLAYVPLALQTVLPGLLGALREREHDARVDLVEMAGGTQREELAAGRIDMAFSDGPILEAGYGNLRLHREPLLLAVPESHALAARGRVSLAELGDEPLVLHPRREYPEYYDRIVAAYGALGIPPRIREREAGQNCMALVARGDGLLLTPGCFRTASLRYVPLDMPEPLHAEVWATWAETPAPNRVTPLMRLLRERAGTPASAPD
jgi:DNA-binding transcriptional LysR family regulator